MSQGKKEKELKISDMDDWEGEDDWLDTDSDKEKVRKSIKLPDLDPTPLFIALVFFVY